MPYYFVNLMITNTIVFVGSLFSLMIGVIVYTVYRYKWVVKKNSELTMQVESVTNDLRNILLENKKKADLEISELNRLNEIGSRINSFVAAIHSAETLPQFTSKIIKYLAKELNASQGVFFLSENRMLKFSSGFAYYLPDDEPIEFKYGEGLSGQVAKSKKLTILKDIPEGYVKIKSGLGESTPSHMIIFPILTKDGGDVLGVIELSSFSPFNADDEKYVNQISTKIAEFLSLLNEKCSNV